MLAVAAALGALGACGGSQETDPRRDLLVVTIDTLRRDAIGLHGGPATATLDALGAEAVVFDDAYTVAPITLPAHASLFSGLYPASHGARDNGPMRVPSGVTTLAERLQARGWRTFAAVSAVVLDPAFGIDQGFERYDSPPRSFGGVSFNVGQRRADAAVDALLAQLDGLDADGGEPWFAWLHLYDPHAPYDAPGARSQVTAASKREAYEAEVQYVDRELARLVAELKRRDLWDELVVVVTSDHGEGLDDGREPTHGYFVDDTTMRVPLLIREPGRAPARVARTVSLIDVAPTVLELLRVPASASEMDGRSLVPVMTPGAGAESDERTLLLESYLPWISHGWAPFEGGVDAERKVIRSHEREAYARGEEPGDGRALPPDDAGAQAMFADVERRMTELPGRFEGEEAAGGAETESMLQALGYAGAERIVGAGERPDFDALPNAYDKRALLDRMDALGEALARGEQQVALDELRALVELDPENAQFLERLGEMLVYVDAKANLAEAEAVLAKAVKLRPGRARVHLALANCAIARGDEAAIERELRTVLALEPGQPTALYNLSFLLAQRGQAAAAGSAQARAAFGEALELTEQLLADLPASDPRRADLVKQRDYLKRLSS